MKILAISGSLRWGSSNTALLRAMRKLAPDGVDIVLYERLGELPHFNPDLDDGGAPAAVIDFREQLQSADGVLISSPEYAHGVPGTMKNALDWLVSTGELVGKPVALINASPRSAYALAQLIETLTTMSWNVVAEATITLPLMAKEKLEETAIPANEEVSALLREAIDAFVRAIRPS